MGLPPVPESHRCSQKHEVVVVAARAEYRREDYHGVSFPPPPPTKASHPTLQALPKLATEQAAAVAVAQLNPRG